jgi:hypothetical protein
MLILSASYVYLVYSPVNQDESHSKEMVSILMLVDVGHADS